MAEKSSLKVAQLSGNGGQTIQLKLRDIHQLFNSMDPSPFIEKDLDEKINYLKNKQLELEKREKDLLKRESEIKQSKSD